MQHRPERIFSMSTNELLLQINVPFCVRRCAHCCYPFAKYDPDLASAYTKAILKEIESTAADMQMRSVKAIAFDGGSPALLSSADLQSIIRSVKKHFALQDDVQIILPTMPGDYSRSLMEKMRDNGVNFWIVGLETVDLREHELLKRPYRHDALTMVDTALRTFHPRALSFDLLYGIPGQTLTTWKRTLDKVLTYEPDHLSLLPLTMRGSLLQADCMAGLLQPMSREKVDELAAYAKERLSQEGFASYTFCDYALPGRENRFRLGQLQGVDQLGIGYHAVTRMDGFHYTNGHSLEEYLAHPDDVTILASNVKRIID